MASALTVGLALLPLIVVFVGIIVFRLSGAVMAIIGWALAALEAATYFRTSLDIVLGASIYGIIKAFGITIAVLFTMLMIFTMKEVGALSVISDGIKRVAKTKEQQALFIGIGFGTFVTSLGVVTPALFPPLLMAMGFGPAAAVSVAVIGYNASTSFALLSLPITIPSGIPPTTPSLLGDPYYFAFKISIFLPVISTLISIAMLWVIGGKESLKKGWIPAILSGVVIGVSALLLVLVRAPIMIVGVLAGLFTMIVLYFYQKYENRELEKEKPIEWEPLLRALSPWIILIALASVVSIPAVTAALKSVDGSWSLGWATAHHSVDLDVLASVYFWIFVAYILSLPILRVKKAHLVNAGKVWIRRIWGPFIAYSLFFSISFIMAYSAMVVGTLEDGSIGLLPGPNFQDLNMNVAIGSSLASLGPVYVVVASLLGLFGAVVGGSETGSNVMFKGIQHQASKDVGLSDKQFMTIYGAHANAGGIASAITPSKINNAVATIGGTGKLEAEILKKNTVVVLLITAVLSVMTWVFVSMGI